MMHPVMYEEIYRNARYFIFAPWRFTTWLQIVSPDESEAQEKRSEYFAILFQGLKVPPEGILLSLLKELFPTVDAYLNGNKVPPGVAHNSEEALRQRRIYHPDFFPRYFILQVPDDFFGEKDTSAFVDLMNKQSEVTQCVETFCSRYQQLQDLPMKRWDFLRRVESAIPRFKPLALEAIPIAISRLSDRFEEDSLVRAVEGTTARNLVFVVANRLRETPSAQTLLERVLGDAISDRFATEVLNDCTANKNRELQDWSKVDASRLEEVFRERMRAKYIVGGSTFFPTEGQADFVSLGRWGLCGQEGRAGVEKYLRREFEARHSNVGRFLLPFFVVDHDDPRTGNPMKTIGDIYFPTKELEKLIDEYGDSAHSSPTEARAISEFKLKIQQLA